MLNIFTRNFVRYRKQWNLFQFTRRWLFNAEPSIWTSDNSSIYLQFNQFNTCGHLNRNEDGGRILQEFEHYADDPKSIDICRSMEQLAQKGRIDDAIAMYEKSNQDESITLTMVNILVKAKRLKAAKVLVINKKMHESPTTTTSSSLSHTDGILCSIFNHLVRQLNSDEMNIFIENLIFKRKFVGRTVLEIIINGLISKNVDFDRILTIFERMANQFHETPLLQSIACELIKNDDTERLEWILTISTRVHGRVNSLFSLALALNAMNRIDQARKIFTSLGIERESERLEQCIENMRVRQQTKHLENLLIATKECVPMQYREQIYVALLQLYAYKNAKDEITRICTAMDQEKIIPTGQLLEKIGQILKRSDMKIPDSWKSANDKVAADDIDGGDHRSELKLKSFLDANDFDKANELVLKHMQAGTSLDRKFIRYCLLKNAENSNIEIFQHLKTKLDIGTKIQLKFHRYECSAYLNAGKCEEYLQMIQQSIEENKNDLKMVATQLPENLIDLIDRNADLYERYLTLAKQFADNGIIKPICISWTCNFLNNKNTDDNQMIWTKYLQYHGTILCNVITKLLLYRKQSEKLNDFLNYDQLDKNRISKSELGKTYSVLFDKLYYSADYNGIICELKKMLPILPIKYLKSNTLNRLKLCPNSEFKEQFWRIVNDSK